MKRQPCGSEQRPVKRADQPTFAAISRRTNTQNLAATSLQRMDTSGCLYTADFERFGWCFTPVPATNFRDRLAWIDGTGMFARRTRTTC